MALHGLTPMRNELSGQSALDLLLAPAVEAAAGESAAAVLARLPPERITSLLADLEALEHPAPEDFVDLGEEKAFEVQTSEGECAA